MEDPMGAEAKDKATLLRYCGLQFSCEKKTHFVALSTPKTVPPLPDRPSMRAAARTTSLSRDFPCPTRACSACRSCLWIKSMPKHEIKILEAKGHAGRPARGKPVEPVLGNTVPVKGHVIVVLTKEKTPRVASTSRSTRSGKDVLLDMQAACEILGRMSAVQHDESAGS